MYVICLVPTCKESKHQTIISFPVDLKGPGESLSVAAE